MFLVRGEQTGPLTDLYEDDGFIAQSSGEVFIEAERDDVQGGVVGVEYAQGLELEDGIGQCVEFAVGGDKGRLEVADAIKVRPVVHRDGDVE